MPEYKRQRKPNFMGLSLTLEGVNQFRHLKAVFDLAVVEALVAIN